MSKKLILNAAETEATVSPATLGDIVGTAFSTTEVLTGAYALAQRAALVAGGMMIQNVRLGRGVNILNVD